MKKNRVKIVLVVTMAFVMPLVAFGAVPGRINFQGRLLDANRNPRNGTFSMTFSIWDALTGGSQVWSETQNNVQVTNGMFAVQLGAVNPLTPGVFSADTRYLQIQVGTEVLTPRERLVTSPYAFRASSAVYADSAGTVGAHTHNAADITAGTLVPERGGTGISGAGNVANRVLLTTNGTSWSAGQISPGTMIAAGTLPSNVVASSIAVNAVHTDAIRDSAVTDAKIGTGISATKIAGGAVDNAEFGRLDGVTSPIQTQIDGKQAADPDLDDLADGLLTPTKVGPGALRPDVIASSIAVNAVYTGAIRDGAIVPGKIASGNYFNDVKVSSAIYADNVGNLPANAVTTDTAQTISGIKTFTSSVTITAPGGLGVIYGICAGTITLTSPNIFSTVTGPNSNIVLSSHTTVSGQLIVTGTATVQGAGVALGTTGTRNLLIETDPALGAGIRVSTNVYIVGFASATKYFGDGSALTGITATVPPSISVSTINATPTTPFGGVNITTNVFIAGNVGIGTTSPGTRLEVSGHVSLMSNALVVDFHNGSGVTLEEGDVVVVNEAADLSVTRATTTGNNRVAGVVVIGGPAGSIVKVAIAGIVTVKVNAATSRGNFLRTSTTAGVATPTTTNAIGNFAIALTSTAGAGTVRALFLTAENY